MEGSVEVDRTIPGRYFRNCREVQADRADRADREVELWVDRRVELIPVDREELLRADRAILRADRERGPVVAEFPEVECPEEVDRQEG